MPAEGARSGTQGWHCHRIRKPRRACVKCDGSMNPECREGLLNSGDVFELLPGSRRELQDLCPVCLLAEKPESGRKEGGPPSSDSPASRSECRTEPTASPLLKTGTISRCFCTCGVHPAE